MNTISPVFQQVSDLDSSIAEPLLRWGLSLADTKHKLGMRISEWVNGAPALEAAVGAAAITQDELGHARSLFSILRQFPDAPPDLGTDTDLENRTYYHNPRILDKRWESWVEVIAANVLIDRALTIVFETTQNSQFLPLRQRAGKILQEERFHRIYGDSWFGRLSSQSDDLHTQLQETIEIMWQTTLAWLGPDDNQTTATLYREGILTASPQETRERWLEESTSILEKYNFAVPSTQLDWSRWDEERREIPPK